MSQRILDDPHGAGQWKVGRSEHGKRVVLFRHTPKLAWEALDIHITPERVSLFSELLNLGRKRTKTER